MNNRILSLIVDHIVMSLFLVVIVIPAFFLEYIYGHPYDNLKHLLFAIGLTVYLNKDLINGRSLAKRSYNLFVKDIKSNNTASGLKCFIRNLFVIIWPVEVLFILVNKKRRLGDFICGTSVEVFNNEENQIKFKPINNLLLFLLTFSFIYILIHFTLPVFNNI